MEFEPRDRPSKAKIRAKQRKYPLHPRMAEIFCVVGIFTADGEHRAKILFEENGKHPSIAHGDQFPDARIRTGYRWFPRNGINWMSFGKLKDEVITDEEKAVITSWQLKHGTYNEYEFYGWVEDGII